MRKALARLLKTHGFWVEGFALGEELLAACATRLPDCLVLDLHMPGLNGFAVLEHFAARRTPITTIVVTGHDAPGNAERVRALGAVDYLLKPLDESQLLAAINKGIRTVEDVQSQTGDP